jgi:hypothetical protein
LRFTCDHMNNPIPGSSIRHLKIINTSKLDQIAKNVQAMFQDLRNAEKFFLLLIKAYSLDKVDVTQIHVKASFPN